MTLVLDKIRSLLPHNAKISPSGWTSFNAPCCHHKGHKSDDRKRGGVMFTDTFVYNCFNCKHTAYWEPGRPVSEKLKQLCRWLGATDDDIKQLTFEALKTERADYLPEHSTNYTAFEEKELPTDAKPISWWINCPLEDMELDIIPVLEYMLSRGLTVDDFNFYWSPHNSYKNRLLIPFWYQGKIVGWTGRKISEGKPKYLSDQPSNFVFNLDQQKKEHQYLFVCEGPFDAIAVNGVALLTNNISDQQARIINSMQKIVIVVPDQDSAGMALTKKAIEYNWSVAFPNWEAGVKDCADAVNQYGKLFVIVDLIQTAQQGAIKINIAQQNLQQKFKTNILENTL
jgi:hypothetical protein